MSCTNAAEAWTAFWADQSRGSRCMARSPELCEILDAHWHGFACILPPQSKVIDLGCGAGAVGHALHAAEPRLHVTGIDIARVPPPDEPGFELLSGAAMESLPFPDCSFGAAVSQFGYEYARAEVAAKEIARVLVPEAPFSFLLHHPEGPIVTDMRRHRRAIESLCDLRVQAAFFSGNEMALADRFAVLRQECSNDPIVEQAERGLYAHIRDDSLHRLQVWKDVAEALAPELLMLDSLGLCCADDRDIDDLVEPLNRWFEMSAPTVLRSRLEEPVAWAIEGRRLPRS